MRAISKFLGHCSKTQGAELEATVRFTKEVLLPLRELRMSTDWAVDVRAGVDWAVDVRAGVDWAVDLNLTKARNICLSEVVQHSSGARKQPIHSFQPLGTSRADVVCGMVSFPC